MSESERRCYYDGCVATWRHWHGFLPGGYNNPEDPTGVPLIFEGDDPEPDAVRDYNGAVLMRPGEPHPSWTEGPDGYIRAPLINEGTL